MKGQMMIITAVIVSLIMLTTATAVSEISKDEYEVQEEGYVIEMVKNEASKVDKRFRKNRENFRKMVKSLERYDSSVEYWEKQRCFNVTMESSGSRIILNCIG